MLLGCLIDGLPYAYFQILRWVVPAVCVYRGYLAFSQGRKVWMWIFIPLAVLFNPLAPIYLDRETWVVIDVVSALVLLVSLGARNKKDMV